jgi:uncharacterized protein YegL
MRPNHKFKPVYLNHKTKKEVLFVKKDLVELVFILDRSGSMGGLEEKTVYGFNHLIEKQKKLDGDALITTVLFDHDYEQIHKREHIKNVNHLTLKDYYVRGTTALLDAVGRSIHEMIEVHKKIDKRDKPEKTLFVITTDGMENASVEYSYPMIKDMIEKQKKAFGWEFIFLGANIDSVYEGGKLGIDPNRTARYHADETGVDLNFKVVEEGIRNYRMFKSIDDNWNKEITKDYLKRK